MTNDGESVGAARSAPAGFGDYSRLTRIGRGGTATVYSAVRATDGTAVAIKIFDDGEGSAYDRQVRAAELLASVPGVLDTLDHGTTPDGRRFTVAPFIAGGSLSDHLARFGALSIERVGAIGTELATALAAAHHGGVLHRDLKPSNVLLDGDDSALLSDFGAASFLSADTASATMALTLLYAAPEVLEGAPADARSDVYSLGLTLLTAATGRGPFGDLGAPGPSGVAAVVNRICTDGLPDDVFTELPDGLGAVLRTATRLDPAERFADAGSMTSALAHVAVDPHLVPDGTTGRRRVPRRDRRRRLALGIGAAVLALGVAGGTAIAMNRSDVDDPTESLGEPVTVGDDRLGPLYEQGYANYVGLIEPGCEDDEHLVELSIHAGPEDFANGVDTPWEAVDGEGAGTFMSYMPCDTGIDQARYLLGATGRWFVLVAEFPEEQYELMSGWMRENENSPSPDYTVDDDIRATLADPDNYRGWAIIDQEAE